MTIETLRARLTEIRAALIERDHEKAHALEDALHVSVLRVIATGELTRTQAALFAHLAASTRELAIQRWGA